MANVRLAVISNDQMLSHIYTRPHITQLERIMVSDKFGGPEHILPRPGRSRSRRHRRRCRMCIRTYYVYEYFAHQFYYRDKYSPMENTSTYI